MVVRTVGVLAVVVVVEVLLEGSDAGHRQSCRSWICGWRTATSYYRWPWVWGVWPRQSQCTEIQLIERLWEDRLQLSTGGLDGFCLAFDRPEDSPSRGSAGTLWAVFYYILVVNTNQNVSRLVVC